MLENSFGLFYFLKQPKTKKSVDKYVYLRITVNGKSRDLSIKRNWPANRWSQSSGKAIGTKEDARNLNSYLEGLSSKIYQAKLRLIETEKQITAQSLKDLVIGKGESRMLLDHIANHNRKVKLLIGKGFSAGTLKHYRTSHNHLGSFISWKYKSDDLRLNDLNYEFISDYAHWLRAVRNCANNSVMKYIASLKMVVSEAVRNGWISDPFTGFKMTREEVNRIALTQEEVNRISGKTFIIERLNNVKDIFLFCCYTGLAYIDIANLRQRDIATGLDGDLWIMAKRQKTGTPSHIPLLPAPLAIMERYKDHPKCVIEHFVLPVLTNQRMNAYLKEIADVCGIDKNLTFHIARYTFATTITLNNGVPIETVSKMLGHKSLVHTQHYAKILDTKVSEDMAALRKKLMVV